MTLIRSTLSSMSIYFMSLLCMPRLVRLKLEQSQRDFLRSGEALDEKSHIVRWSTVFSNKMMGGLGVICHSNLNRELLFKWIPRFANERDFL